MNMSSTYVGQINLFAATNQTPQFWIPCDGRSLEISQYTALFKVIGTQYGGDGESNFSVPNIPSIGKVRYLINSNEYIEPTGTIGEITLFSSKNVPKGWIKCDGTVLKINDYPALHLLIGDKFGHSATQFSLPSIPPPCADVVYAICQTGASPWVDESQSKFSIKGTIGSIQLFPTPKGFASDNWFVCNGQSVDVTMYQNLYGIIGNTWGGNGQSSFKVPSIEGPAPGIAYIICSEGIYPSNA